MSLADPDRLELPYTRSMLAALLFIEPPLNILMLGLGGGSLAKFLSMYYPNSQIEIAECRAAMVDIAHDYFYLPRTERLKIHIGDGCSLFIEKAKRSTDRYDLILIDGYDHEGMDSNINAVDFFTACAQLLKPTGAFSINMWGSHNQTLRRSIDLLRVSFPERSLVLPVLNKGNVIGIGLGSELEIPILHRPNLRSKELEAQLGIEISFFYSRMRSI